MMLAVLVALFSDCRCFFYCFPTSSLTLQWPISWFTLREFTHFILSSQLIVTLSFFSFDLGILLQSLRLGASLFFNPKVFFTLHTSSTFLHICDLEASRDILFRIFLYDSSHLRLTSDFWVTGALVCWLR